MTDTAELATELEVAVRAVPGVIAVYPATPIIATVVGAVVDAVVGVFTERSSSPTLVLVSSGSAGLTVTASIGVAVAGSAAEVCRAVHDTIAADLERRESAPADVIRVTVASIG